MATARKSQILLIITVLITICSLSFPSYAKYSGGTGEPNDPYQIATADDLLLLGETPEDYDKHFVLTDDIDLDPNLPGRKVFDKAVIASWGIPFTGVFDGNDHSISRLTIKGEDYVGLFGYLEFGAEVKDLGVVDVKITGSGYYAGGLVGSNGSRSSSMRADRVGGTTIRCYTTGAVSGNYDVGGLMGYNGGTVLQCYSTGVIIGEVNVGGLVGENDWEHMIQCFSTGGVSGTDHVGGLVGCNGGVVKDCYTTGSVSGNSLVGGLAGDNRGTVTQCYSTGGGLAAYIYSRNGARIDLTTAEMMDPYMLGLNGFANDPNWVLEAGRDYPRLSWDGTPGQMIPEPNIDWLEGNGTAGTAYLIATADQLIRVSRASALWDKCFLLSANIDLDPNLAGRHVFQQAVIQTFSGVFDGNGHTVSHLTVMGVENLGLFGHLAFGAKVKDLGIVDVNITGSGSNVGGLVGYNDGSITNSYSTGMVSGDGSVGGLVGINLYGSVTQCYSSGSVNGNSDFVGGLVGRNEGTMTHCYSTGAVSGKYFVGGLVGFGLWGVVTACLWDTQTSGRAWSAGGTGKTTAEMQTASTFLAAGWDFIDETANGTDDIWWINEGKDYPRLWWELIDGNAAVNPEN